MMNHILDVLIFGVQMLQNQTKNSYGFRGHAFVVALVVNHRDGDLKMMKQIFRCFERLGVCVN